MATVLLRNLTEVLDALRGMGCTVDRGMTGEIFVSPPMGSEAGRAFVEIGVGWAPINMIPDPEVRRACTDLGVEYDALNARVLANRARPGNSDSGETAVPKG